MASNISLALKTGISVEKSLDDLSRSIAKSKSVVEHGKRQNYESRMMLRYLVPVCYIMSATPSIFDAILSFCYHRIPGSIAIILWFVAIGFACRDRDRKSVV